MPDLNAAHNAMLASVRDDRFVTGIEHVRIGCQAITTAAFSVIVRLVMPPSFQP